MNLFSYTYKNIIYDFRMSYGAKLEIEKIQNMGFKVFEDKELAKAAAKMKSFNKEFEEMEEEVLVEVLPLMSKFTEMDKGLDPVDVGFILLKNNPKFKDVKKEFFFEILNDMEETLGFEETMNIFKEMSEKVFMVLGNLKVSRKEKKETMEAS